MKVLFFTEARLTQTADNKFYSADQSFSHQMFKRYLKAFDSVLVVARTAMAGSSDAADENTRVDNAGVTVLPLPYYIGPYQYLLKRNGLLRRLRHYIDSHPDAAVICRVPGAVGTAAARYLWKQKRPYGVEVVGVPTDVFAPGSFDHPFRAVFQYSGIINLKAVVKRASAALYVSKETLQARYPTGRYIFSTYASNVMLPPEAFVDAPKLLKADPPYRIVAVGSLAAMYKSPDIVIKAIAILKQKGVPVTLQWLGGGRYHDDMLAMTEKTGVSDRVAFVGHVGMVKEVRNYLDAADLFIIPSRQEGLPRALLEAMARGLPCIGTNIGGIPELLDKNALVAINNPIGLAEKIEKFLRTPELADAQAKQNLLEAKNYAMDILDARRLQFYAYLKGIS